MQSSTESFWSEIKMYEERLKKDPASYCFAPLVEVYLQAGLLDDALAVARAGVIRYPGYVAGQIALARTCHQKGLVDECRKSLEVVVRAVPDHAEAQRMLARLYAESGALHDAIRILQTSLDFNPDDMTAKLELESLKRKAAATLAEDEDLELIELTEADIFVDEPEEHDQLVERVKPVAHKIDDPWAGITAAAPAPAETVLVTPDLEAVWSVPEQQLAKENVQQELHDPLVTPTLAELYVSQGFLDKAIEMYRTILATAPENKEVLDRLAELEHLTRTAEAGQAAVAVADLTASSVTVPSQGTADQAAVTILEGWLENIRGLRKCR
jgi:predicted Zn-dependent protease